MSDKGKPDAKEGAAAAADAGGAKSPMPLILVVLVAVPLICYGIVDFLVVPKLTAAMGIEKGEHGEEHGAAAAGHGGKPKEVTVEFEKSMVSLSGSGGNRYLRVTFVLAGKNPEIKEVVEKNQAQLKDAVITVLSALTLGDVEKSDGRDVVKRALLSRMNGVLGADLITQIYFTEFVIQ